MLEVSVAPLLSRFAAAMAQVTLSGGANVVLNQAETDLADLEVTEESGRVQMKVKKLELSRCPIAPEIKGPQQQILQVGNQKRGKVSLIAHFRQELGLPPIQEIGGGNDDVSFMSETQAHTFHKQVTWMLNHTSQASMESHILKSVGRMVNQPCLNR